MKQVFSFILVVIILTGSCIKAQDQHYIDSLTAYLKGPDSILLAY